MNMKATEEDRSLPYVRQISICGAPQLEVYRPTTNPIYIYTQVSNLKWNRAK